jgi:K+/H+ antiporter YhaU regulatory subunit KhtT
VGGIGIRKKVTNLVKGEEKAEESFNMNPSAQDFIEKGDILVVIGRDEDLDRLAAVE